MPSKIVAAFLLAVGFLVYLWLEVMSHSMFYPLVATAAFAAFFALPAFILLCRASWRLKLGLTGVFLLLIFVVRVVECNTRKPFLNALDHIQNGMTSSQVDATMRGFMRSPQTGVLSDGQVGFRHTQDGWGDADVGLVTFADGRVVKVEYLPD